MTHPAPPQPTPDGRPHDIVDIINHLAEWLEPLRISIEAADVVQGLLAGGVAASDAGELARLNAPARAWMPVSDRVDIR